MDMESVIPSQSVFSGLRQTGTQQGRRLLDIAQRVDHQFQQVIPILRAGIADLSLGLRPNVFFRVEFRRVGRKPFQMQPAMATAKLHNLPIPVNRAAVQQHDDRPAQMPQQLGEVLHNLNRRHVPRIYLKIESQSLAHRRHGQSSDDGEPLPAVAVPQHGRPPHRRPGALHRRNEHKPAFIEEHQMRAASPGFFLYAANRAAATVEFSRGGVGWPVVRVSGNSSPGRSESSRHAPDDKRCPNVVESVRRHGGWSTSRSGSPPRAIPVLTGRSTLASAGVSFVVAAPAWAEASTQPCPCAGRIASSAQGSLSRIELSEPQLGRSDLASKAQPPWCAAPAIVRQSLRVSQTLLCHSLENISIIYARLNNA